MLVGRKFGLACALACVSMTAVLSAAGCSDDAADPTSASASAAASGSGGATASSTTGGGGTTSFGASTCAACAEGHCVEEVAACRADPGCATYLDCVLGCPLDAAGQSVDLGCAGACPPGDTADSQAAAADVFSCMIGGAGASCLECGGSGTDENGVPIENCPESDDPNPCYVCEDEACCIEWDACLNGPCSDYFACVDECYDTMGVWAPCMEQCGAENPEGQAQDAQLHACTGYWCAGCGVSNPCDKCLDETCRVEWYRMLTAPLGLQLYFCVVDCVNADGGVVECADTCYEGYPEQREDFDDYFQCIGTSCNDECG